MNIKITFTLLIFSLLGFSNCNSDQKEKTTNSVDVSSEEHSDPINLLTDINPIAENGVINAIIEIPAGTIDKWELNKTTGKIEWEIVDNIPRKINYIGYPGNYGMIPKTLLPKQSGGDGDPLDILVLGPPAKRGEVLKCKVIGLLYLTDRGEQDDKLIAVSNNSSLYSIDTIEELNDNYKGISEIVQLWFTNYKGPNKLESKGFGNKDVALKILNEAIAAYHIE